MNVLNVILKTRGFSGQSRLSHHRGHPVAHLNLRAIFIAILVLWGPNRWVFAIDKNMRGEESINDLIPQQPRVVESQHSGVFHGRLRTRLTSHQLSSGEHMTQSRLDSDGGWERMGGSRFTLAWSGNLSYRDGNTSSSAQDFRNVHPTIYKVLISQKLSNSGFNRLGRFIPLELASLGYVDGLHWNQPAGTHWRYGNMIGTRPDRVNMEWSRDESIFSGYGSFEAGKKNQLYFKGTLGVMQTLWHGKSDELAALYDQRLDLTSKLNLYANSQVDFKTNSNKVYSETRLKRLNAYLNSPVSRFITFRAGTDFYERPDTKAERHITGENNLSSFYDSVWRHSAGSSQYLFWSLRLDEDLTYIRSSSSTLASQTLWRYSVTRNGFWFSEQASLTLSVFELNQIEGDGTGAALSGLFPFFSNRVTIDGSTGFQYAPYDVGSKKELKTTDWTVHAIAHLTTHLDLQLGAGQSFSSSRYNTTLDSGITYRW